MKINHIIILLSTTLLLSSCSSAHKEHNMVMANKEQTTYFFAENPKRCIQQSTTDTITTFFVCNLQDSSFKRFVDRGIRSIQSNNLSAVIKQSAKIDSSTFWKEIGPIIDSTIFNLSEDWKVIDQTSTKVTPYPIIIPVDRLKINSRKYTRMNISTLLFNVIVNKSGQIENVAYGSDDWWAHKATDLIESLEKELLQRNIQPYTVLGKPIKTRIEVNVKITDAIT